LDEARTAGKLFDLSSVKVGGVLDLDRCDYVGERERVTCNRVLWKTFQSPAHWNGRKVWFTYDARRLVEAGVCEVRLNGQRLPVALPVAEAQGYVRPVGSLENSQGQSAPWFVEISERLRFGAANLVELRVKRWPVVCSAGVWLYSQPEQERVLFLQSADLSAQAQDMVARYAGHVKRNFAVEPLLETKSFANAAQLRRFLVQYHRDKAIGGAVLIGSHELPSFRFSASEKYGGQPRFYEDLDAVFEDRLGNDGFLDYTASPANFGCEIWTSFIRRVPECPAVFERYLAKLLDYYEGRLYFPTTPVFLPPEGSVRASAAGLDHYDLFFRPAHLTSVGAHGGKGHTVGPHLAVSFEEAQDFFPGALVVQLSGCHAGDIRRTDLTNGEAYLFGRSNTQCLLTSARSEGGSNPTRHIGWRDQLLACCPHWGICYSYLRDLRGTSRGASYLHSGYILLGNPFVNFAKGVSATGGTVAGRVLASKPGDPVGGFYVAAHSDAKCFGRVRTDADGSYALHCLPPGRYRIVLNLNALEALTQETTVGPRETRSLNWTLPLLWRLNGQVLDEHGRPDPKGWAEMAAEAQDQQFVAKDILGMRTDTEGRFEVFGSTLKRFWLRGRAGRQHESEPVQVRVEIGQKREALRLRLVQPEGRKSLLRWSADELLDFEPQTTIEVPERKETPGQIDVRRVHFCLIPNGDPTLPGRGRPPGSGADHLRPEVVQAPQTVRIGLEMAETPDRSPEDKQYYFMKILAEETKGFKGKRLSTAQSDYVIRISHKPISAEWSAKIVSHTGTTPFWITGKARLIGSWVIIDLNPLASQERLNWRIIVHGSRRDDQGRHVSTTPEQGCLRLQATLGERPQIEALCETIR